MWTTILIAATLAPLAAQAQQIAIVTISSNQGSVAGDLTNTTVNIPLTSVYTDASVLHSVSTLYVTGAQGVPLTSIYCTPFKFDNGTGLEGSAFTNSKPCLYKTNAARLGSIVCISNNVANAPPPLSSASTGTTLATAPLPSLTTKHKSKHHKTDTKTHTDHTNSAAMTITSAASSTVQDQPTKTPAAPSATSTTTTSSHQNVGNSLLASSEFFTGLALAGLGLAFAL